MHNRYNLVEMRNVADRFRIIEKYYNYKNVYYLKIFLFFINRYYKNTIKKDVEISTVFCYTYYIKGKET